MSKNQTLRVLVTERLTAAAEEIFCLFERTMAEYEEELRRCVTENQRKQRLLDEVYPRVQLPCAGAGVHGPSQSPGPGANQKIPATQEIKKEPKEEEEGVKHEEEPRPLSVPTSSTVCVKREEFSLPQTQEEDISSEPHFHSETEEHTEHSFDTYNYDDWGPPFSFAEAQKETEADGDLYNQVQIRDRSTGAQYSGLFLKYKSAGETSAAAVNNRNMSGADEGAGRKKHQCFVCKKRFMSNLSLQIHIRVHTGERPYSCPVCEKKIAQKGNLKIHMRTHTNEKPYSCSICGKAFARKDSLDLHNRIHTGEKPYSCSLCNKDFYQSSNLKKHIKTHMKRNQS